ncbi:hypothetical protein FI667_g6046, partial [Globisporangium splendens]
MWRKNVKRQLQQEQQRWCIAPCTELMMVNAQSADTTQSGHDSDNEAARLHQLSISRLLRNVLADRDDGVARELRERWKVERVELHPNVALQLPDTSERHGRKRTRRDGLLPTAASGESVCKQALYASRNVWLIGFLRFPDEASTVNNGLHLCDANAHVHALLLEPRPECIGQLVLIKKWTLVDTDADAMRMRSDRFFLEVHDHPIILRQSDTVTEPPSLTEVMQLLVIHYPKQEPPLYTGARSWRAVVDEELSNGSASSAIPLQAKGKSKKKKVYAVYGRLVCVSPVSNQCDRSSCHYLVEVEYLEATARVQSVVNIMFAGAQHLRWRVFLQPGRQVLITDLIKVFSRECGIFLLQTTTVDQAKSDRTQLGTEVFVWHDGDVNMQSILHQAFSPTEPQSAAPSDHNFHCEGVAAGITWNDCLELHGDPGFVICLFHFPGVDLEKIRRGATVRILNAHVIRWPHPVGGKIVLGRFLNTHQDGTPNCSSVEYSPDTKALRHEHFATIKELQKWVKSRIVAATEDKTTELEFSGVHAVPEDLKWCLLLGCIRGNIHSGDLEICDRTGSLPLCIRNGSQTQNLHLESHKCLYLIRQFELRVESCADPAGMRQDADDRLLLCTVVCSVSDIVIIPMDGSVTAIHSPNEAVDNLSVLITDVGSVNQSSVASRPSQPVYRHVRGIALPFGSRNGANEIVEQAPNRVELLISSDCPHWYVEKYGFYKITGAILDGDQSANPDQPPSAPTTAEERSIMLATTLLTKLCTDKKLKAICFEDVVDFVHEFDSPALGMRSPALKLYRIEGSSRIHPLAIEVKQNAHLCRHDHERCVRPHVDQKGFLDLSRPWQTSRRFDSSHHRLNSHLLDLAREKVQVRFQTLILCSLVQYFAQQTERVVHVKDLMCHSRSEDQQQERADKEEKKSASNGSINRIEHQDIHKKRLISIIGVITDRRYYWVEKSHNSMNHSTTSLDASGKRTLQDAFTESQPERSKTHDLMCRYRVRSLFSVDAIEIVVNLSRFGAQPSIQTQSIVEFSKLLGFIARSTYKVYMTWGNSTSVRELRRASDACEIPSDAQLHGAMQTSRLNDLYHSHSIDRALHKWVVRVVYVSYVVLKRKCRTCHQVLQLEKHRASWVHQTTLPSKKPHKCSWHQVQQKDPRFRELTSASLSMRCIIDDGSAQAELFLENDVAWELLACSAGSKRRFEDMVSSNTSELSYFTGQSVASLFSPSRVKDDEYYRNEFRSMIVHAMQSLRQVVVFGQRFYTSPPHKHQQNRNRMSSGNGAPEREVVSVLTFGKDIQITTKTVANAQLEARRVDTLHVKSELRQRLASLIKNRPPSS